MRPPRGLSPDEAALWARVAATVKPINPRKVLPSAPAAPPKSLTPPPPAKRQKVAPVAAPFAPIKPIAPAKPRALARPLDRHGLDGTWDRKLATAAIQPDFTLDLHGCNLDAAHDRLDYGLTLAINQSARVVLVITGRPRPVDAADRGQRRGAIRAKLLDWLAAAATPAKSPPFAPRILGTAARARFMWC